MPINLRHATAAIFIGSSLFLAACSTSAVTPAPQIQVQPAKLKVTVSPYLTFAPFYIASSEGYFSEQQIEVEFVQFAVPRDALSSLEQGQLDVLGSNVSPAYLNSVGRGGRMRLVADKGYISATGCTDSAVLARKTLMDSKTMDDPSKIRQMKASASTLDFSGYVLDLALNKKGLTLEDIQVGTALLTEPVIIDGFAKGTLDLAYTDQPLTTRIIEAGNAAVWVTAESLVPDYPRAFVIYGPNLLEKNPEVGRRFMIAYLKGVKQYAQGKSDRNLEIISKATQLDKDFLRRVCWPALRPDGMVKIAPLLDFQKWSVKRKLVDSPVTDDKTLWDPSFVEYANKVIATPAQ